MLKGSRDVPVEKLHPGGSTLVPYFFIPTFHNQVRQPSPHERGNYDGDTTYLTMCTMCPDNKGYDGLRGSAARVMTSISGM